MLQGAVSFDNLVIEASMLADRAAAVTICCCSQASCLRGTSCGYPLHPSAARLSLRCSYIVLNRPYALLQWVKAVTIPEK